MADSSERIGRGSRSRQKHDRGPKVRGPTETPSIQRACLRNGFGDWAVTPRPGARRWHVRGGEEGSETANVQTESALHVRCVFGAGLRRADDLGAVHAAAGVQRTRRGARGWLCEVFIIETLFLSRPRLRSVYVQ